MFRFKRPFFHFGSGCLLTDEAARLMLGSETIWNVSGMHAVSRVSRSAPSPSHFQNVCLWIGS